MKRLLIPFVLLATLLTFVRIGFALSGPTLTTPNIKQLLVDGDMEKTNAAVALVDGNMEATAATTTDGGAWTALNGANLSKVTASPYSGTRNLRVSYMGTSYPYAGQYILTIGHTYHVTGWARGNGSAVKPRIYLGAQVFEGTTSNSWQQVDVTAVATGNNQLMLLANTTAAGYAEFDDISITDVTAGSWGAYAGAIVSKSTTAPHSGRQALHSSGTGLNQGSVQTILTVGKRYHVTGWARGDGTVAPSVMLGGFSYDFVGTTSATWQRFDFTKAANGSGFYMLQGAGTGSVEFDDVFVTEVTGYTQVQDKQTLTDGDMEGLPVALADAAMEAAGTGSWTASQATLSKQTTNPHGGTQVLRVAYDGNPAHTSGEAYQSGVLTAGRTYRLTGWARADSGGVAYPMIMDAETTPVWTGVPGNAWQYIDTTFVAAGGSFPSFIEPYAYSIGAAGRYAEFDDISIVDIGATAWITGGTVTKETTNTHGGKYCMRVAGAQYSVATQYILTIGKTYHVTGWVRGDGGTGYPTVGGISPAFYGTTSNVWQRVDIKGPAVATNLAFYQYGISGYAEYDDIEVTEYKGQVQVINKQILADGDMESTNAGVALVDGNMEGIATALVDGNMEGTAVVLADATMEAAGTANWTGFGAETKTKIAGNLSGVGSQYLRITQTAPTPGVYQNALTNGHTYHVTGWARGDGTANPFVSSNDASMAWTGTSSVTPQHFDYTAAYTGVGQFRLWCQNGGTGNYCDFDDITITDVGTGAWTAYNSATLSKVTTNPHSGSYLLRVVRGPSNVFYAYQSVTTIGHTYHVTGYARSDGTTTPNISNSQTLWAGTTATSWQPIDWTYVASATSIYFGDQSDSSGYVDFDDITVTDVGTNAWTTYQSTITKQTTTPHSGSRCLRVGFDGTNAEGLTSQSVLTTGKTYKLSGWARGDGTTQAVAYVGGGAPTNVGGTANTWVYFEFVNTAINGGVTLGSLSLSTDHYVEFDDITITDVTAGKWPVTGGVGGTAGKITTTPHGGAQAIRLTSDGSQSWMSITQSPNPIIVGKVYKISGWARGDGTAYPVIYAYGPGFVWQGTTSASWQRFDTVFTASSAGGLLVRGQSMSLNKYVDFDDVMVTLVQ